LTRFAPCEAINPELILIRYGQTLYGIRRKQEQHQWGTSRGKGRTGIVSTRYLRAMYIAAKQLGVGRVLPFDSRQAISYKPHPEASDAGA
jgi:hypothetical protein